MLPTPLRGVSVHQRDTLLWLIGSRIDWLLVSSLLRLTGSTRVFCDLERIKHPLSIRLISHLGPGQSGFQASWDDGGTLLVMWLIGNVHANIIQRAPFSCDVPVCWFVQINAHAKVSLFPDVNNANVHISPHGLRFAALLRFVDRCVIGGDDSIKIKQIC